MHKKVQVHFLREYIYPYIFKLRESIWLKVQMQFATLNLTYIYLYTMFKLYSFLISSIFIFTPSIESPEPKESGVEGADTVKCQT